MTFITKQHTFHVACGISHILTSHTANSSDTPLSKLACSLLTDVTQPLKQTAIPARKRSTLQQQIPHSVSEIISPSSIMGAGVKHAISSMKNKKSSGYDGITSTILK
jgi:hypothetical protein